MKKFVFTLQKILNFREQILEKEKNTLSQINMDVKAAEKSILELTELLQKEEKEFKKKAVLGMESFEVSSYSFKHQSGVKKMEELLKQLERLKEKSQHQTLVVVEASKEVKKLEKLKEKQREQYLYEDQKAQAEQIGEQVIIKLAYSDDTSQSC